MDVIIRWVIYAVSMLTVILQVVGNKRGASIAGPIRLIKREAKVALRALAAGARDLYSRIDNISTQFAVRLVDRPPIGLPSQASMCIVIVGGFGQQRTCGAQPAGGNGAWAVSYCVRKSSQFVFLAHDRQKNAGTRTLPFLDSVTAKMVDLQKLHGQIVWKIPAECIEE